VRAAILRLATTCARHERENSLQQLQHSAPRLGSLGVRRKGIDVQEVWEDGLAFKELGLRLAALAEQREAIEVARKVRCSASARERACRGLRCRNDAAQGSG
jgi:hypothetical protein